MYSRNYACGDPTAKITPPPAYSGSAIQGKETGEGETRADEARARSGFGTFSQSIPLPKNEDDTQTAEAASECALGASEPGKEKGGLLSGLFDGISTEDLVLIGIVIALAFDLWDRDILLVALVVAVVLM